MLVEGRLLNVALPNNCLLFAAELLQLSLELHKFIFLIHKDLLLTVIFEGILQLGFLNPNALEFIMVAQ